MAENRITTSEVEVAYEAAYNVRSARLTDLIIEVAYLPGLPATGRAWVIFIA